MKRLIFFVLCFFLLAGFANAQATDTKKTTYVTLEYYDDPSQVKILDQKGFLEQSLYFGIILEPGNTIKTQKSSAELRLVPNGTIFKMGPDTEISIQSLRGVQNATDNHFTVTKGKLRVVAAKMLKPAYTIQTVAGQASVAIGSDFGFDVQPGVSDRLFVRDGQVDFSNTDLQNGLFVKSGQGADALSQDFTVATLSAKELGAFFKDMEFQVLNPADVPGENNSGVTSTSDATPSAKEPKKEVASTDKDGTPQWVKDLRNAIGVEAGALSLNGETYGKLVLKPKINTGKIKMGFYIPFIFKDSIFSPTNYYHPYGNDEWSFGSDQGGDSVGVLTDVGRDIALKIQYLEIGDSKDPVYIKAGEFPSMTLGHGFLLNEYANDADFPSVRRLGAQIGINTGTESIQGLVSDLLYPEVFGLQLMSRPVPTLKAGVGFSVVADIKPSSVVSTDTSILQNQMENAFLKATDPIITLFSADLDIPLVSGDALSFGLFGDVGGLIPYIRNESQGYSSGFRYDAFVDPLSFNLRNFGWMAGFEGKAYILNYRVDFRYTKGAFQVGYVDQSYDRTRASKAIEVLKSMSNMDDSDLYQYAKMGVNGSGVINFYNFIDINAGYFFPWETGTPSITLSNPDSFVIGFSFRKNVLPYGVAASFEYSRTHFKELLNNGSTYKFLDEFAVLRANLTVPVGEFFKLRANVGSSIKRTTSGEIDVRSGSPVIYPIIGIEVVIGQ